MTATQELRDLARMFSWSAHVDEARHSDTFICGQHMVAVDYRRDGAVEVGRRYEFASVKDLRLRELTGSRNRKDDVRNWLISLGH